MQASPQIISQFEELHKRYVKAHQRMNLLQQKAIEGMKHIGVGCIDEAARVEFDSLKSEIEITLAGMKEICGSLH